MRCDSISELYEDLIGGVEKIKKAPEVEWESVAVALITSVFFGGVELRLQCLVWLCLLFVEVSERLCLLRLEHQEHFYIPVIFFVAKTIYVLADLRDKYDMNDNILTRK